MTSGCYHAFVTEHTQQFLGKIVDGGLLTFNVRKLYDESEQTHLVQGSVPALAFVARSKYIQQTMGMLN